MEYYAGSPAERVSVVSSPLRGLGPAKQCGEIELHTFTRAAWELEAADASTPFGLHRTAVIAYFFMLREIELSLMLLESVTLEIEAKLVKILLPASKKGSGRAFVYEVLGLRVRRGHGTRRRHVPISRSLGAEAEVGGSLR